MTSATNALDENRRPEEVQQNSYSPVVEPANNQALIKEVITDLRFSQLRGCKCRSWL
jgi:hypothetical protein